MTTLAELEYAARRAEREAILAMAAGDDRVAAIHHELSLRYGSRFRHALGERELVRIAMPA